MNVHAKIEDLFRAARGCESRDCDVGDRVLRVQLAPDVFPTMSISIAVARAIPPLDGERVADLGTGTGILAMAAVVRGAGSVLATDLNRAAVTLARHNVKRNGFEDVCVVEEADWMPAGAGQFDLIVSNPPCMPIPSTANGNALDAALRLAVDGGPSGNEGVLKVLEIAANRLALSGRVIIPIPHWSHAEEIEGAAARLGFRLRCLASIEVPYWIPVVCKSAAYWDLPVPLNNKPALVEVVIAKIERRTES